MSNKSSVGERLHMLFSELFRVVGLNPVPQQYEKLALTCEKLGDSIKAAAAEGALKVSKKLQEAISISFNEVEQRLGNAESKIESLRKRVDNLTNHPSVPFNKPEPKQLKGDNDV